MKQQVEAIISTFHHNENSRANDDRQEVSADGHGDDTDTNKAISNVGGGSRRCNKKAGQEKKQKSKKKSKRRRRNSSSPRRRCIIPEARVVQLADEQAYISNSSSEEDEEMEALIRRDIRRFTRVFTPATHPEFFVFVNRNVGNGNGSINNRRQGRQAQGHS